MGGFDERKTGAHMKMLALVGAGKKVLEVGCGRGSVSERLQKNGCAVTAIEINPDSAESAGKFCERVIVGDIETLRLDFKRGEFDVILFGDVLEHLRGPLAVLLKLKPFLGAGGRIVVSVPNVANWKIRLKLLFGKFDYAGQGIMDRTHLRFFTRKTILQLIGEAGFKVEKSDFVPSVPFHFLKPLIARVDPNLFAFQFLFSAGKK